MKKKSQTSFAKENPDLLSEWSQANAVSPLDLAPTSTLKVRWVCQFCQQQWLGSLAVRNGTKPGCKDCKRKAAWEVRKNKKLENSETLVKLYPEMLNDFDPALNPGLEIEHVFPAGKDVLSLRCHACGNLWKATVNNLTQNGVWHGCPDCSRLRADKQRQRTAARKSGSVAQADPAIFKEWDFERNEVNPEEISQNSTVKVWWRCGHCGHSYSATPSHRINAQTACRDCSFAAMGTRYQLAAAKKGFFGMKYPELLEEWDYERNDKPPQNYSTSSNKKVYWRCRYGHRFELSLNKRTARSDGCPECNLSGTSRNELRIYCELKNCVDAVVWRDRRFGTEMDIYLPDLKLGIEYDGCYWHKDKEDEDRQKNARLLQSGVTLIRIRERGLSLISAHDIEVPPRELAPADFNLLVDAILKFCPDTASKAKYAGARCSRDFTAQSQFQSLVARLPAPPVGESFADKCPAKLRYWDYDKNFPLTPDLFLPRATHLAHWKCPDCGSAFQKTLDRVYANLFVCVACARPKTAEKRKNNELDAVTALSVRPMLARYVDAPSLATLKTSSPGSSRPIRVVCPECQEERQSTVKQALKNKYVCRHCGV